MILDNGRQAYSNQLRDITTELNIGLQQSPDNNYLKGKIEIFFKNLNFKHLSYSELSGSELVPEILDHASEKLPLIRLNTLEQIIYRWIVDIYQNTPCEDGETPDIKWKNGVKNQPPRQLDPDRIPVIFGTVEERQMNHEAIRYSGILYQSDELSELYNQIGSRKLHIKVDSLDMSVIYVFNTEKQVYIKAYAKDQGYAAGLSLIQHGANLAHARRSEKEVLRSKWVGAAEGAIRELIMKEVQVLKGK